MIYQKRMTSKAEGKLWDMYCAIYPHMDAKNFVTWDDYLAKSTVKKVDKLDTAQASKKLAEFMAIHSAIKSM